MSEHRPVCLVQNILSNMHNVVRPESDYIGVEGGMMDLAHSNTVGYDRSAALGVALNVGSVEQFDVP